jgi:hypothetical protein
VGIANTDIAWTHLKLAAAYSNLVGDSATGNTERALSHARQALDLYEAAGDAGAASRARLVMAQMLVHLAGKNRGEFRMRFLDQAEEHLSRYDLTAAQAPGTQISWHAVRGLAHFASVFGIGDETMASLVNPAGDPTRAARLLALQLRALCAMLRYSDGVPDLDGLRLAVELHKRMLAETDRSAEPEAWGGAMFSLATMYTRYPEPTDEMLDRAEEALRQALEVFQARHADFEAGLVTMALGATAFRRRRWSDAASWLREAAEVFAWGEEWSRGDRGVISQVSQLGQTYARLSYALYRSGRPPLECLEWLERGKTRLAARRGGATFDPAALSAAIPSGGALVVPVITSQGAAAMDRHLRTRRRAGPEDD